MLIYTNNITNRIRYIFQTIFTDVWNTPYELTNDLLRFKKHEGPKINYSMRKLGEEFFVECNDLLLEKNFRSRNKYNRMEGLPVFSKQALIPLYLLMYLLQAFICCRDMKSICLIFGIIMNVLWLKKA